jgi:hypothetical protein
MTKKQIIAAIVVGVLVALGIAAWVYSNNKETVDNAATPQAASSPAEQTANSTPNTIDEFLAVGKDQKCTISTTSGDTTVTGTMYFASNKKMSAEYTSVTADKTTMGNMIITNNVQYFWAPSSNQGVKINLSGSAESGGSASSGLDTNKEYNFKCEPWTVDEAKFAVPSNVTFLDFSDIQSQLPQ